MTAFITCTLYIIMLMLPTLVGLINYWKGSKTMMSINSMKKANEAANAIEKQRRAASATLKEAGFPTDPIDILSLLEDKAKLAVVVKKLNLKAFW